MNRKQLKKKSRSAARVHGKNSTFRDQELLPVSDSRISSANQFLIQSLYLLFSVLNIWTQYIIWLLEHAKKQVDMDVMTGEISTEISHITTVLISNLATPVDRSFEYANCAIRLGLTETTQVSDSSRVLELFTEQLKRAIYKRSASIDTKRDELVAFITPKSIGTAKKQIESIWDKTEHISRERSPTKFAKLIFKLDKTIQKSIISPIKSSRLTKQQGITRFACKSDLIICRSIDKKIETFNQALKLGCPKVYDDWKKATDNAQSEIKTRIKTIVENYMGDIDKGYVDDSCDVIMPIVSVLLLFIFLTISYVKYTRRSSRIKLFSDSGRHRYNKTRNSSTKRKSKKSRKSLKR